MLVLLAVFVDTQVLVDTVAQVFVLFVKLVLTITLSVVLLVFVDTQVLVDAIKHVLVLLPVFVAAVKHVLVLFAAAAVLLVNPVELVKHVLVLLVSAVFTLAVVVLLVFVCIFPGGNSKSMINCVVIIKLVTHEVLVPQEVFVDTIAQVFVFLAVFVL